MSKAKKKQTKIEREATRVANALGPVIKQLENIDRRTLVYSTVSLMAAVIVEDIAPDVEVDEKKIDAVIWAFVDNIITLIKEA